MAKSKTRNTQLVLGTAGLGGIWGRIDREESLATISDALEAGISKIDTAPAYGNAESILGEALQTWHGTTPELSTKVGKLKSFDVEASSYDYSEKGMMESAENSLKTLDVDKVHTLFLHEPENVPREEQDEVVSTMLKLKQEGLADKIGLGGNIGKHWYPYLKDNTFEAVIGFNRLDATCLDALEEELAVIKSLPVEYYQASPLHMGLLGNNFKKFTSGKVEWVDPVHIERAKKVKKIAQKYDMELPCIAHRFIKTLACVDFIIIGAKNRTELASTLDHFKKGVLSQDIVEEILSIHEEN